MTLRLTFFIAAALVSKAACAQLFGAQQIISSTSVLATCVHSADMDGDGDMDVLATSSGDDKVAWFENLGGGLFSTEVILTNLADMAQSVYTADLDGDGDLDAISASLGDDNVSWYRNLGGGQFGARQHIISVNGAICVRATDVDADGFIDVISSSPDLDRIYLNRNQGNGTWGSYSIVVGYTNQVKSLHIDDLDGDGFPEVLCTSFPDDEIIWFKNLSYMSDFPDFDEPQIITTQTDGAESVYSADIDGDGDSDVLSASYVDDEIAWYENLGFGSFGAQQIISSLANGPKCVYSADLDNDGDMDVLSASQLDNKVAWYENLGGGNFGTQQVITTQAINAKYVYAADLDADGDLDVLSASSGDNKIAWYENLTGQGCMDVGACNYDANASEDNGSCCYTNCGCTDPIATNYAPTSTCENGSCTYVEGCTNELASNFNPLAITENGTCTFNITGTVFFDENENGVMDSNEYGLPFQTVVIQESGQMFITNDAGNFIADIGQLPSTTFTLQENLDFPFNTNLNPVSFDPETAESTQLLFGVSNQSLDFEVDVNFFPSGNFFLCNDFLNHTIFIRNMGNVPIDGIIELEYDPLFQGYQEVTPIDSVIGNFIYMSYENLLPGQMFFYNIELLTPTVDHIGEYVTNVAKVFGYYEGNQVAYGEKERTMEIACAYDPNDKQAFPLGYTDQHLLLQETQQEYVIRFQNTGNAPAQNIRVQDTLDVNFDIESFRIIANSHSVMTTIDPETRLVDFYFENIQLPDSVSNEPASHGLISYMITPLPDLPVGTVLENTAYIYFDNNDPIITNTTWTTIHECGGESVFEPFATVICDEPQVNFESSYELVEEYSWQVDGVEVGVNPGLLLSSLDNPEYEVTLTASNPLCTETTTLNYVVPDIASIDPCRADFNCDGNRDTQDLLVFMSEFGCLNACDADLDDNAIVNVSDLFIFISVFDRMCWE